MHPLRVKFYRDGAIALNEYFHIEPITQVHSNSRPGIPRPDIVVIVVDDGADVDVTVQP